MLHDFTALTVLLVCGWIGVRAEECPIVEVKEGKLQGREQTSAVGKTYCSFQGIPYATPPLGELRFKDAKPAESWDGVRDATKEGCICTQFNSDNSKYEGCEDCLFLNVYTPKLPKKGHEAFPVMFWIHGGGYVFGSGNQDIYGPDYLLAEDVVVVTINYRLSAFGFLFLKEEVPGNAGLKDQVLALKWVQKNIAAFNGDPNKVTIFGESSGGSSVDWHMWSPMSKGLFHGAICQSGAIFADQQWKPYETSKNLAKAVGCDKDCDKEIVECLRRIDNIELMMAAKTKAPLPRDRDRMVLFTFIPTMEERRAPGVDTFVTGTPEELMRHGCQHDVPYMVGINDQEWMYTAALNETIFESEKNLKQFDSDWKKYILPETCIPDDCKMVPEAMNTLKEFFLDGKKLTFKNLGKYTEMLGDLQIAFSMYYSVHYMAKTKKEDIFLYHFIADQSLNLVKKQFNMRYKGAAHGDEMGYLFHVFFSAQCLVPRSGISHTQENGTPLDELRQIWETNTT